MEPPWNHGLGRHPGLGRGSDPRVPTDSRLVRPQRRTQRHQQGYPIIFRQGKGLPREIAAHTIVLRDRRIASRDSCSLHAGPEVATA
jgi:hypothetical protein